MGTGAGTAVAGCPKVLDVLIAGAANSDWATTTITTASTAIKTDSDGYTIQISQGQTGVAAADLAAADKYIGGCLVVTGITQIVCFNGKTGKDGNSKIILAGLKAGYAKDTALSTTVALATTEITVAKWYVKYSGSDCTAAVVGNAAAPQLTVCIHTAWAKDGTLAAAVAKWFQPKQLSDKKYTGAPRFAAKDTAKWTSIIAADGKKQATSCTEKALTGASALVAGAAVAFGAAALAF
jgi:hypothetical protein